MVIFCRKSCRHKLVVSTSFWSWLLKFFQFWHLWITQRQFFWFWCVVGMLKVNRNTNFLVFVFFVSEISHFLCLSLMRSFVVQIFFIFQDIVWLIKKIWRVHCFSIHQFYWVSDRCRSGFELWRFLSEKSCRHKLVVSTSFCSWLLKFLQFWHLWITQWHFFLVLVRCGYAES